MAELDKPSYSYCVCLYCTVNAYTEIWLLYMLKRTFKGQNIIYKSRCKKEIKNAPLISFKSTMKQFFLHSCEVPIKVLNVW